MGLNVTRKMQIAFFLLPAVVLQQCLHANQQVVLFRCRQHVKPFEELPFLRAKHQNGATAFTLHDIGDSPGHYRYASGVDELLRAYIADACVEHYD